jgi:hypothetical protein
MNFSEFPLARGRTDFANETHEQIASITLQGMRNDENVTVPFAQAFR